MIGIYEDANAQCGYVATRFLQMVTEQGGLQAAKSLLRATELSDGFTALWLAGRLDLTMEAMIVEDPVWRELFTSEELEIARNRLNQCNHETRE
ncbi:MAG: hypothetical protein ACODAJ_03330 [Planctomycetota bacterium]